MERSCVHTIYIVVFHNKEIRNSKGLIRFVCRSDRRVLAKNRMFVTRAVRTQASRGNLISRKLMFRFRYAIRFGILVFREVEEPRLA